MSIETEIKAIQERLKILSKEINGKKSFLSRSKRLSSIRKEELENEIHSLKSEKANLRGELKPLKRELNKIWREPEHPAEKYLKNKYVSRNSSKPKIEKAIQLLRECLKNNDCKNSTQVINRISYLEDELVNRLSGIRKIKTKVVSGGAPGLVQTKSNKHRQ
ncbi:hypothetical protein [Microbulbifer sp. Q7]|uniref:hypothetical protein n=1 Tax=Microbulbifer sp. Q7 TaxID=1785091 RepID=UPI00082C60B8|nr:hypothetical protein [Microbulbifer sp. Q7]